MFLIQRFLHVNIIKAYDWMNQYFFSLKIKLLGQVYWDLDWKVHFNIKERSWLAALGLSLLSLTILNREVSLLEKKSKYGVFSGPYFPVLGLNDWISSLNTEKYGLEKTPYLDTFHAVCHQQKVFHWSIICWVNH